MSQEEQNTSMGGVTTGHERTPGPCTTKMVDIVIYRICKPLVGSDQWYAVCEATTVEGACEVVKILLTYPDTLHQDIRIESHRSN